MTIKYTYPRVAPIIKLNADDILPMYKRKTKLMWNKEHDITSKDLDTPEKTQKYIAMLLEDIRDNLLRARRPKHF